MTSTTQRRPATGTGTEAATGALRVFAALSVATTLAVLVQGVTAGQFVDKEGEDSWITVHGVIADVTWGLALVAALVAVATLRRAAPRITAWSAVLFVLALAQTGLGHLITDSGKDDLIPLHVPLAMVIMGLTAWVSVRAVRLLRSDPAR